jgi:hypothetical protein
MIINFRKSVQTKDLPNTKQTYQLLHNEIHMYIAEEEEEAINRLLGLINVDIF